MDGWIGAEVEPAAPLERLPSLTGLRFVAASGVFMSHAVYYAYLYRGPGDQHSPPALNALAAVSVSLFFILSGFVLTWSARAAGAPSSFWRRRLVKIYPSHVVAWFVIVAFLGLTNSSPGPGGAEGVDWLPAMTNLFLVNAWIPDLRYLISGNPVAWSLASEAFFYVLFPVLIPLFRRIPRERLLVVAGATVVAVWAVPMISLFLTGGDAVPNMGALTVKELWFAYMFPLSRLPEFILGMILACIVRSGMRFGIGIFRSFALVFVAVAASAAALPPVFSFAAATVIPLALLVQAVATIDLRAGKSLLRSSFMVFLGEISYAFFLTHLTVVLIIYRALGRHAWGDLHAAAVGVLFVVAAVVVAWVVHMMVERPCVRRFATRRAPTHGAADPIASIAQSRGEVG